MNFSYDTSFEWPFSQDPNHQCMDGPQWGDCTSDIRALHQDRISLNPGFFEGQSYSEVGLESLSGLETRFFSIYDASCAALLLNTQSVPLVQVPDPLTLMDPWRVSSSASWRPRPLMHHMPAPARAIVRSGERYDTMCAYSDSRNGWPSEMRHIDSMVGTNAAPGVQFAPGRLAEVRTVQRNTHIYNDEHNGNHLPVERTFAEAISVPIAGPDASPPCPAAIMDKRTLKKIMVSSARARTKTRDPTRELHDARPHICTKHRTAYRHHGDLVRHKRTTPGHTAYQGPVTCVCRREYSRRDGMYKHLKTKKCTGPPRSWV